MPYPRAHYYVLLCIAVIAVGFWPSYFVRWGTVPWQFHAHGVAASIWVIMVFAQSWTAHHKQLSLHRAIGKSSLLLFPFLIGGLMAIIDLTAKGFVAGNDPFRVALGGEFLIGMLLAIAAYVTVFYRALKFRRKVWIHSGYMLTTPLILFESPFSRVMGMVLPQFAIRGPQDMDKLIPAILTAMAISLAIIAVIWLKYRAKANPFLLAGVFIAAQMLTMSLMSRNPLLEGLLMILGQMPSVTVVMTGMAIGAATSWAGWQAGKRPTRAIEAAAQGA